MVYNIAARLVSITHLFIIGLNVAAIPFVICREPFYIWMPVITMLVSPLVGGTYCMFNRLENFFRVKAGLPTIEDRMDALFKGVI